MTDPQVKHITNIIEDFKNKAYEKYEKGQMEHGGNLWENPLITMIDFAIEEAIDQYVYLYVAREHEMTRLRKLDEQKRQGSINKLQEEVSHINESSENE